MARVPCCLALAVVAEPLLSPAPTDPLRGFPAPPNLPVPRLPTNPCCPAVVPTALHASSPARAGSKLKLTQRPRGHLQRDAREQAATWRIAYYYQIQVQQRHLCCPTVVPDTTFAAAYSSTSHESTSDSFPELDPCADSGSERSIQKGSNEPHSPMRSSNLALHILYYGPCCAFYY